MQALLGGDIEAYFPHAEWDVLAQRFWRDIKAPDQMKSWVFEVNIARFVRLIHLKTSTFEHFHHACRFGILLFRVYDEERRSYQGCR